MANKRPNKVTNQVIASQRARARKDIKAWRTALQMAENVDRPKRLLLYNLYDELILDAHLSAEIQRRVLAVLGSKFSVVDSDGETNNDLTNLFKKPWFYQFMEIAMDSIFWGHSLIQIGEMEDGEIKDIELVKRRHVIPEKGVFVFRQGDEKGIIYRDNPEYSDWLIEIGKRDDFGLLNKCTPHILYKRFAQAAWSEHAEIFGMPLRFGKTNVKDTESLNRMENMLAEMGAAAYAVVDDNESIEFVETNGGKGEIYQNLIKGTNDEISKLINGAVIGDSSEGGSRSKEEVGERLGKIITKADKDNFISLVNFTLIPKLIEHGYPLDGYQLQFEETKDITELWEITKGVMEHYDVKDEFITETFGIPVNGIKKPAPNPGLNIDPSFFFS